MMTYLRRSRWLWRLAAVWLVPALVLAPVFTPRALAAPQVRVLAYGFRAPGQLADLVPLVSRTITQQMRQWSGTQVLAGRDVQRLSEMRRSPDLVNCAEPACLQTIAGSLGASEFLTASFAATAQGLRVRVERFDAGSGDSLGKKEDLWPGSREEAAALAAILALGLYVDVAKLPPGTVTVLPDAPATVLLDGSSQGDASLEGLVIEAAPGRHELTFEAEGFKGASREIVVLPEGESAVRETLIASGVAAVPWYKTWWFWTLVAGAATGATLPFVLGGSDAPTQGTLSFSAPGP